MTSIIAVADKAAAYLMTDTLAYDLDGTVRGFYSKARVLPHLGIAYATSGTVASDQAFERGISRCRTAEEFFEALPNVMQVGYENGHFARGGERAHLRVTIASWSKEDRVGETHWITTRPNEGTPYKLVKQGVFISPEMSIEELRELGFVSGNGKAAINDIADFCTQVIQLQRRTPVPPLDNPNSEAIIVGGAAVLTCVNASGISQRTVLEWPDVIGFPVDPDAAAVEQDRFEGLSRLQRERMQKKIAKGTLRTAV